MRKVCLVSLSDGEINVAVRDKSGNKSPLLQLIFLFHGLYSYDHPAKIFTIIALLWETNPSSNQSFKFRDKQCHD